LVFFFFTSTIKNAIELSRADVAKRLEKK